MANNIDYSKRSFNYYPTNAIVLSKCIDGKWTEPEVTDNFNLSLHCFAGIFHYAPSCFEGLKAFEGADGKVRLFRPDENAKRMISSAQYLDMPAPTVEMFIDLCVRCVQANWDHIPPYECGASLYLRPVLFGINPQLGIKSANDVMFAVMASGVGTYSGARILTPGTAVLSRNYDRAATFGSGGYKLGANYAQSLHATSPTAWATANSSSWIPPPIPTSKNSDPPTSSPSRTTPTSPRIPGASFPPSPTRVSAPWPRNSD